MVIYLGNLSVAQIERRLGIEFPQECRDFMNATHQDSASNIQAGKWHCFDLPFNLACGDRETATKIFEWLKPLSGQCKTALEFSIAGGS